ncbi:MAG: hypothetical protein GY862_14320, partial [Gammaproteobacteria bacterium]|nr:hypothetical protein [Gammaproteobacteria bacterium]
LSLKEFAHALILPLPDMNSVFGLGGVSGGSSFSEGINEILATEGLAEFTLSQQPNGILLIKGIGQYAGMEYAFIPDVGNIVQAGEEIPVGLSVQEGGWYVLTVPGGQQFTMVPAPKDPAGLQAAMPEGGAVSLGARGDVLLTMPAPPASFVYQAVIFDPFIEPAPAEICTEISVGQVQCDWSEIPTEQQPGVHIFPQFERISRAVYSDGASQQIKPTVPLPMIFIKKIREFPGVESAILNMDGSFDAVYQGAGYHLAPLFGVQARALNEGEQAAPAIVVNADSTLTYTVSDGTQVFSTVMRIETR